MKAIKKYVPLFFLTISLLYCTTKDGNDVQPKVQAKGGNERCELCLGTYAEFQTATNGAEACTKNINFFIFVDESITSKPNFLLQVSSDGVHWRPIKFLNAVDYTLDGSGKAYFSYLVPGYSIVTYYRVLSVIGGVQSPISSISSALPASGSCPTLSNSDYVVPTAITGSVIVAAPNIMLSWQPPSAIYLNPLGYPVSYDVQYYGNLNSVNINPTTIANISPPTLSVFTPVSSGPYPVNGYLSFYVRTRYESGYVSGWSTLITRNYTGGVWLGFP